MSNLADVLVKREPGLPTAPPKAQLWPCDGNAMKQSRCRLTTTWADSRKVLKATLMFEGRRQ
eukprot:6199245-Pleurochrysis_carterae.AAC.1